MKFQERVDTLANESVHSLQMDVRHEEGADTSTD